MNRHFSRLAAAWLLPVALSWATAAGAQPDANSTYPAKPVRIIVPFAAGGVADALPRLIGQKLGEKWGKSILVDNKPGAAGNIGMEAVSRAAPDGYTLGLAPAGNLTVNPILFPKLGYDTRDFVPVTMLAASPNVLVVNPAVHARSLKDLVSYAKAHSGRTQFLLAGQRQRRASGGRAAEPGGRHQDGSRAYNGMAPALNDVLAGQVQMMFGGFPRCCSTSAPASWCRWPWPARAPAAAAERADRGGIGLSGLRRDLLGTGWWRPRARRTPSFRNGRPMWPPCCASLTYAKNSTRWAWSRWATARRRSAAPSPPRRSSGRAIVHRANIPRCSKETTVKELYLTYLNGPDVAALALTDAEILAAVEGALAAQGRRETVIEPRVHLVPESSDKGHFNVLRGFIKPLHVAGVKVVSDYVDNYKQGLPSEMALLNLFDPDNGVPLAVIDATAITDMRTGAVTALGARHLARKGSKILGHVGARGTSYWNVRLLDSIFDFDEIRVHSRRPESRDAFAARLTRDLGKPVIVTDDWESCVRGADIIVEASRLPAPTPMLLTEWIKPGALVIPYGTMSAVELSLTDIMSKMVVDDWGQCRKGLPFGALRQHVDSGRLNEENLHAELGQIVAGLKPGRERDDETILFWHRGLSTTDIALGHAMLTKARALGLGQTLRFA